MTSLTSPRRVEVRTTDGVLLRGTVLPPTRSESAAGGDGPAIVLGHGITNATHKPSTAVVANRLATDATVYAFDFRGHGRSEGRSSVGRDEVLDLDAVVRLARADGHSPVVVVGFSMGASVALRQAALGDQPPDAVVSVSSPSRWYIRETGPMRRVHWMLESPFGKTAGRMLGIRLGEPWAEVPPAPLEVVGDISVPLLIVHGTRDAYFGVHHAEFLHRAAPRSVLWIEPGMGHAESATGHDLVDRITDWIAAQDLPSGPGAPPPQAQSQG